MFYPGCLVLSRFHEYELASRRILEKLGIEAVGIMGLPAVRFLGREEFELLMANEWGEL